MLTVATIIIMCSLELRKQSAFYLRQGELQDLCDFIIQLFNTTHERPKAENSQTTSQSGRARTCGRPLPASSRSSSILLFPKPQFWEVGVEMQGSMQYGISSHGYGYFWQ